MNRLKLKPVLFLAAVSAGMIITASALADKPPWAGNGKEGKEKHHEMNKEDKGRYEESDHRNNHDGKHHRYFNDDQRTYIQNYYADRYHRGHCPPGLAKKNNGCMPPGQAKKWTLGRPLPPNVIFYDLPPRLQEQLGPPPSKHRFIRVAQDILLIAVGTGMVVDAIDDLDWEFNRP